MRKSWEVHHHGRIDLELKKKKNNLKIILNLMKRIQYTVDWKPTLTYRDTILRCVDQLTKGFQSSQYPPPPKL